MTEEDVKAMEVEVLASKLSPEEEHEWATEQIAALEKAEARTVALWKLHRALRDDAQMSQTFEQLKRIRETLAYCRGVLKATFVN